MRNIQLQKNFYKASKNSLETTEEVDPRKDIAQSSRGSVIKQQGCFEEVIAQFKTVVKMSL